MVPYKKKGMLYTRSRRRLQTTAISDTASNESTFSLLAEANQALVWEIPYVHTFDVVRNDSNNTSTSPNTNSDNVSPSSKTDVERFDNTSQL